MGRSVLPFTDLFLPKSIVHASPTLVCMCFAAGLNVAVTRTPFSSPLILANLWGQPNIITSALCAAIASLFVTRRFKFMAPQKDREDLLFVSDLPPLEGPTPVALERNGGPRANALSLLEAAGAPDQYTVVTDPVE